MVIFVEKVRLGRKWAPPKALVKLEVEEVIFWLGCPDLINTSVILKGIRQFPTFPSLLRINSVMAYRIYSNKVLPP